MKLHYLLNGNQAVPVKLHLLAQLRLNRLNSATWLTDPNLDYVYIDQKHTLPIINTAEDTFFISPFIVTPVLLQIIVSTLMSLLMACRKCIQWFFSC